MLKFRWLIQGAGRKEYIFSHIDSYIKQSLKHFENIASIKEMGEKKQQLDSISQSYILIFVANKFDT